MAACFHQVDLSEEARQKLILATLSHLHNAIMEQFVKDQTELYPLNTIKNIYAGLQELNFGYYTFDYYGSKTLFVSTTMATSGALSGQYSTPGFGELVSENQPTVKYKYTAFLTPPVFNFEKVSLVMELEVNTELNPEVCCGEDPDSVHEKITNSLDYIEYEKTGPSAKFNHTVMPYETGYYDTQLTPKCLFSVTLDRAYMKQKVGQLEGGFRIGCYLVDEEGDNITDVNENTTDEAYCTDSMGDSPLKPLTRWFNILHHLLTLDSSIDSLWEIVKAVKLNHLWKKGSTKCLELRDEYNTKQITQNLDNSDIESLLDNIDEAGSIDSSSRLSPQDLTDLMWITGFKMFSYLAYCPDQNTRKWATFYTDTLAKSPLRGILEKISNIAIKKYQNPASNFGSIDFEKNTLIELEIYKQISKIVPLKNVNATIGLSPALKLFGALNNPIFASVKDSLQPCLESGSCKEVEKIIKSISKDEYTLAQSLIRN